MASEDVIELGSSEDELEPTPKRTKPRPNAMVHIPTNLHGITIKPTSSKNKPTFSKTNIPVKKGTQKQAVAYTNVPVHNSVNQFSKSKPNGKTVQKHLHTKKQTSPMVNPVSLIRKLNSQQVVINKISPGTKVLKKPMQVNSSQTINKLPPGISITRSTSTVRAVRSVIPVKRVADAQVSNSLLKKQKLSHKGKPTGEILTVELDDDDTSTSSTASPQWYLRPEQQETSMEDKNNKEPETSNLVEITIEDSPIKPKSLYGTQVKDLLSVNIDDSPVKLVTDKKSDATASEEEDCTSKKVPNSKKKLKYPKEAETPKTIEIEIEPVPQLEHVPTELPVKYIQSKVKPFANDIIVEIEDSPVKILDIKVTTTPKKDNSNSKIKIPNTSEISNMQVNSSESGEVKTLNIAKISSISNIQEKSKSESGEVKIPDTSNICNIQDKHEIEGGEVHIPDASKISHLPDKNKSETCEVKIQDTSEISNLQVGNKQDSEIVIPDTSMISDIQVERKVELESSEFHPIYQSFIDLCFKLENSEDMKKIVEKKVKAYYLQCPKEYTESEEFLDMVSGKILSMKAAPEKLYLYMKDIVDELNLQRKMAKNQLQTLNYASKEAEKQMETEAANFLYGEDSEFDTKRKRQIRKLEKTLKKLHRAIQKLEEQEVDFDDEEDSVYLLTERYKERMVRVHAKFCQLTNTKMPSEPRIQIDPRPGQPSGPAKRLEKWINKKVPIGTPLPFPDFHDVLRCVREANDDDKLGWNEADIMEEARDLFTRCGHKLQRRRQENEWRSAVSRISLDIDPAENNDELKRKLENNRQDANKKVSELLNKYADKQNQLKLEGTEIGDKEAEESPVESEEEEVIEEVPLENKNKRKELLRRLLQEKSRKSVDEKENQSSEGLPASQNEIKIPENVDDTNLEATLTETTKDVKEAENSDESKKHVPGEEENKENLNKDNSQVVNDDDEYKIESDIDELHLLQKLHSENEVNSSTLDSTDSESPIAISDTLESSNEDIKQMSDVISIENSSYSESEINKEANDVEFIETADVPVENFSQEVGIHRSIEMEDAPSVSQRTVQTTNEEYNEAIEDILLASSDDEAEATKANHLEDNDYINLKDDNLSIGETVVQGIDETNEEEDDGSTEENNKISQNEIKSIADLDSIDHKNNENITEETCVILDDDCSSSESPANDISENFGDSAIQAKCIEGNEYSKCVSLDDPTDENTVDSSSKNNDKEIAVETASLNNVSLTVESMAVVISDNNSDDNGTSCIMIESNDHDSKRCLNLDKKHLSADGDKIQDLDTDGDNFAARSSNIEVDEKVIGSSSGEDNSPVCDSVNRNDIAGGDKIEFFDTDGDNFAARSRNIESNEKVIGSSSDENNYPDCDSMKKNAETDINNGVNVNRNISIEIAPPARNEEGNSRLSSPKNKSLNKDNVLEIGSENEDEVVSEPIVELDGNTDVIKFELVTQVSEDMSPNKVDELPNVSNLTEEKTVLKDSVENV